MVALNSVVGSALLSMFILSIALISGVALVPGEKEGTVLTCKDDPSLFLAATIKKKKDSEGEEISRKLVTPHSLFALDFHFEGSKILKAHDGSQWTLTRDFEFKQFPLFTLKLINANAHNYEAGQELSVAVKRSRHPIDRDAMEVSLQKCPEEEPPNINAMILDDLVQYAFTAYTEKDDVETQISDQQLGEEVRAATEDSPSTDTVDKTVRKDLAHSSDAVKSIYEILINKKLQYNEKGAAWVGAAAKLEADSMGSFMISPFASLDIANDINFIPYKLRVISASFDKNSINPLDDPQYEGPQYLRPLQTKDYDILPSIHVTGDTPPLWTGTYLNKGGTYTCSAKIDLEAHRQTSKEYYTKFDPAQNPGFKFLNLANMNIKVLNDDKHLHVIKFDVHVEVEAGVPWTAALALDTLLRDRRAVVTIYQGKQTFFPATCATANRQLDPTTVDFPQIPPVISLERAAVFITHIRGITASFGLGEPFLLPVYSDKGNHPPDHAYEQPSMRPTLVQLAGTDARIFPHGGGTYEEVIPGPEVVGVRVIGILTDETMAKPKVKSKYPVELHSAQVVPRGERFLGFTHYFTQSFVLTKSKEHVRFTIWVSSDTTSELTLWFYVDSREHHFERWLGNPYVQAETLNLFRQHLGKKKCVDSVSYSRASNIYSPYTPLFKRTRLEISETPLHFPSTHGDFIIFETGQHVKADKKSYAALSLLDRESEGGLFSMMLKWLKWSSPFQGVQEALDGRNREKYTAMMRKAEGYGGQAPPFVHALYSPAFVRAVCVEYVLADRSSKSPDIANKVQVLADRAIECQARLQVYQILHNYETQKPPYTVEIPRFLQFLRRDDKMSIFEAHSRHGAPRLPVKLVVQPPAQKKPPAQEKRPDEVASPFPREGDPLPPFTESLDRVVEDVPTAMVTAPFSLSPTQALEGGQQVRVPISPHENPPAGSSEQPSPPSGFVISRPPQFDQFNQFNQNNEFNQYSNIDMSTTNNYQIIMPLIVIIIDNDMKPPTAVAKITTEGATQTCPAQANDQSTQCRAESSGTGTDPAFGSVSSVGVGTGSGPATSSTGTGTVPPASRSIQSQTSLIDFLEKRIDATIMVPSTAQNIERVQKGILQYPELIKTPDYSRPCPPPFKDYGQAWKPKGHHAGGAFGTVDTSEWPNQPATSSGFRNKDTYTSQ